VFFSKKLYRRFKKNSIDENLPEEFFAFASPRGIGEDFLGGWARRVIVLRI
jgi:hypothetical protein